MSADYNRGELKNFKKKPKNWLSESQRTPLTCILIQVTVTVVKAGYKESCERSEWVGIKDHFVDPCDGASVYGM